MGIRMSQEEADKLIARAKAEGGSVGEGAQICASSLPPAKGVEKPTTGMNKTEARYAQHLDDRKARGEILGWWYEWITFVLAFDCRWKPDFVVMLPDGVIELHDTKGSKKNAKGEWVPWIEEDAKVKLHIAGSHFPFVVKSVWWNQTKGEWSEKEYKK